ncbi:NAD(P)/FAD-dependent oxidoreductase [Flavisphingomonas formosensis]|uniref:NAD(P)/FAD-dependent oxidoreductase n=1 Tax=Flavisphingomonas formosensis TaxID=861534 RepID=UPI0012FBD6CF|nr:NAD(P)/FAD-dependent oxidoreductase [Sphingomonas formosensis]
MDRIDALVIGAGAIGLAVARSLARAGRSVLILEREGRFGAVTSSRNSEVIHAGLYYPPGSLKERLCIAGRELLYAYCAERGVPHRRCGKLVVATDAAELHALEALAAQGRAAGVAGLALVDAAAVGVLEPALRCQAALHSPLTGIVDSHALMVALLAEAEDHGALIAYRAPVEAIDRQAGGWLVRAGGTRLLATMVVNAAGLDAQAVAARIDALAPALIPPLHLAKGRYFTYSGRVPFTRLIYPLPVPGGLGTHLTLDLAGAARFGPDVSWVQAIDYVVDPAERPRFLAAARRIWPDIDPDRLHPGYAGIRPKLSGPGEPAADFRIDGPARHGLPGLVNLFGIESPGLTASLAIAGEVMAQLGIEA